MFSKIIYRYIVLLIMCVSWPHFLYADFKITEIMYDTSGRDTNREWIEVQNTGAAPDNLSTWYLFSDNTKHSITPFGSDSVPAEGYAVVAQNSANFKIDYPAYTGLLFDSSWTELKNSGDVIALKNPNSNTLSSIAFNSASGASGDGNSLQEINNRWVSTKPTPGEVNILSVPIEKVTQVPPVTNGQNSTVPIPKVFKQQIPKNNSSNTSSQASPSDQKIINLNDLPASAGGDVDTTSLSNSVLAYAGLVFVVIVGSLGALSMNHKNSSKVSVMDNLTAEDMTLLD